MPNWSAPCSSWPISPSCRRRVEKCSASLPTRGVSDPEQRHCRTAAHRLAGFFPDASAVRPHTDEKGLAEMPNPNTLGLWHSHGSNVSWPGDNRKLFEAGLAYFRDLVSFRSFPANLRLVADAFPAVFQIPGHSFVIGHGVKIFELNRIICFDLGYLATLHRFRSGKTGTNGG